MKKQMMAAVLAGCMALACFTGCTKKQTGDAPVVEVESSDPTQPKDPGDMTPEEVRRHNQQIDSSDVRLIQFDDPRPDDTVAVITTSEGVIRIRLYPEEAPMAVENFVTLAEKGYYNGTTFHQVVDNFQIQAGDPTGTGSGGESIYATAEGDRGFFADEISLNLWHFRGALSMANDGTPDTNSSRFLIVQRDMVTDRTLEEMADIPFPSAVLEKYEELGGAPSLDTHHTVFGMVVEGMEVVDRIASAQVDESGGPVEPVLIENIEITGGR